MSEQSFENAAPPEGCANGCNAPFGIRCSVCNTDKRAEVDNFIEGLTTGLVAEVIQS